MKLKRRILKSPFKVSERTRFHRLALGLLIVVLIAMMGPLGIYLKSTDPDDYKAALHRGQLLEKIFSFNDSVTNKKVKNDFLAEHFALEEKLQSRLLPGAEKLVFFPPGTDDKFANWGLISFHGFQANRQEISPVIEDAATAAGMPVFLSRINHHGIEGENLANLTLDDYMIAINEAKVVGKYLAQDIALVGMSSGASMAMLMASQSRQVKALILITPNFGLPQWNWKLLMGPMGSVIARVVTGGTHRWTPLNAEQAKYWVHETDSEALRMMAEMTDLGMRAGRARADWSDVSVLVVKNPLDTVIDNEKAENYLRQFKFRQFEVFELKSDNHILAGRIVKPEKTQILSERIAKFLKELPFTEKLDGAPVDTLPQLAPTATPAI
jgi:esterase/lipase